MIEAAEDVALATHGRTRDDLATDRLMFLALSRAVEIFGEAAAKMSLETRQNMPAVAWALAIGMRNRLAHAYHAIDYDVLWSTATKEVPRLLPLLRAALASDAAER